MYNLRPHPARNTQPLSGPRRNKAVAAPSPSKDTDQQPAPSSAPKATPQAAKKRGMQRARMPRRPGPLSRADSEERATQRKIKHARVEKNRRQEISAVLQELRAVVPSGMIDSKNFKLDVVRGAANFIVMHHAAIALESLSVEVDTGNDSPGVGPMEIAFLVNAEN